jgi:hypothetical protein
MAEPVQISAKPGPVGIGGWLVWPILGFAVIVVGAPMAVLSGGFVWSWDWLARIFGGGNDQLVALRAPTALTVAMNAALFASALGSLYLVFTKKRALIPVAIAHYAIMAVGGLFEYWADRTLGQISPQELVDPKTARQALDGVAWSLIWGLYFFFSRRVRNTFVEPPLAAPDRSPVEPRS